MDTSLNNTSAIMPGMIKAFSPKLSEIKTGDISYSSAWSMIHLATDNYAILNLSMKEIIPVQERCVKNT